MKRIVNHIIIPAMTTVFFFVVALTPVEVLGCFLRGLIVLVISLVSGLAALASVILGAKVRLRGRGRHDGNSIWWVLSTLILVIPVIAMIILA